MNEQKKRKIEDEQNVRDSNGILASLYSSSYFEYTKGQSLLK